MVPVSVVTNLQLLEVLFLVVVVSNLERWLGKYFTSCSDLLIFLSFLPIFPLFSSFFFFFKIILLQSRLGFPGGSGSKESACIAGDLSSMPGSGRSPGEGNSNPLQYYCLENPMDRGALWATVHGWQRVVHD